MTVTKPDWLRKRLPTGEITKRTEENLLRNSLHTICQEGCCPNQGECFARGVATFLIMGNVCTRNCRFCAVTSGKPTPLDPGEPERLADEINSMGLRFAVITSVTRDDLPDGGAKHFVEVIHAIREKCPEVGIEVLIPDFNGLPSAVRTIVDAGPEVINHNVETVPRLYPEVRPQAHYDQSVGVIRMIREMNEHMVTKSGIMLGLGETAEEVRMVMADLISAGCDILTIGQYLCPSGDHHPVVEYVRPEIFDEYKRIGMEMGFRDVASGPFVRSSYRAIDSYTRAVGTDIRVSPTGKQSELDKH
ncbi:MAG: lipoyl synthase [Deltaproteobacteria bacterium]|nr:lipoyl synthase [Deltaproteobacteria bacterium]